MMLKDLYSQNIDVVQSAMIDILDDDKKAKENIIPLWMKCIAFANGDQISSRSKKTSIISNIAEKLIKGRQNRQIIYQTDEISSEVRTVTSYMCKQKPTTEVFTDDKSERGRSIARVSKQVSDAKYDIDSEYDNSRMSAYWAVVTGMVFRKEYWKEDFTPIELTDEMGNVTKEFVPNGKNAISIISPIQFVTDYSYTSFKEIPYAGDYYIADVEWARRVYNREDAGYTGRWKNISDENQLYAPLGHLEDIKLSVPYSGGKSKPRTMKGKAPVFELFVAPNPDFPNGRMLIMVGDVLVYAGVTDGQDGGNAYYLSSEPTMWHGYSMYGHEPYIGRFWYRGIVEQVIADQMRINEINGIILENCGTYGKPMLTTPEKSIPRGVLSGNGVNIVEYKLDPLNPNAKPDYIPPASLPAQIFEEKQTLIDGIKRRLGTNSILSGNNPNGITAASALQLLMENSTGQMADKANAWAKYHEDGFTKKLRLIQKFNNLPDEQLIKYIRTMAPDATQQEIESFVGSESLSDGTIIKVEPSSVIPKSEVAKQEAYRALMASPAFGPVMSDPGPRGETVRRQLLKAIGLDPLDSDFSVDFDKAKWENERILRGEMPFFDEDDDHAVHHGCHTKFKKDPKILERPDAQQIIAMIDEHDAMHKQAMAMAQGVNSDQAIEQADGGQQSGDMGGNNFPPDGQPVPQPMPMPELQPA